MTPPLIEFVDVTIARHREQLLSRVSLSVTERTIHVIVGPNGAGKTTLLTAALGLIAFDGRILRTGGATAGSVTCRRLFPWMPACR